MNKHLMIGAACAGLVLGYVIYRGASKAVGVVGDVAHAINPLNNQNVINQGVTSAYQGLFNTDGSIGTDFYDALHGGALDWGGAVNPASPNNIINQGVTNVGEFVTGQPGWTLGGQIYDWLH